MIMFATFRVTPAALLCLTAVATPSAGTWHNRLVRAEPGIDSTVRRAPERVELWFTERPDVALSSLRLRASADSGKAIELGKVTAGTDRNAITAAVLAPPAPGTYTVEYRTAGTDGHVIRGSYHFTVAE